VRGRPTGIGVTADGSLLITDEMANAVWRLRWQPAADRARGVR
jgi:glucose/arabinose dehydrogenase